MLIIYVLYYTNTQTKHLNNKIQSLTLKRGIMADELTLTRFLLAVMLGTLFAIVYSMRKLIILERYIARIEGHIEKLSKHILREESVIRRKIR